MTRSWSEGSVLVMLGIAMEDKQLMLDGFKLILEKGDQITPELIEVIYKKLKKAGAIDLYDPETEEGLLKVIPTWITELEQRVEDSEIVNAFLDDLSGEYN
jgi:hypothetical protein|tara:strand:- start:1321 stop:1623 length:303 start_codon:yes stop_codon:yes gene_type:complete